VKQTIQLTEDLLDASRIGRGQLELRTVRVALSTLVNMAMEAVRPLIDKTGQQLTVKQPEEPLMLEADPTRLTRLHIRGDWDAPPTSLITQETLKDIGEGTVDFVRGAVSAGGHLGKTLFKTFGDIVGKPEGKDKERKKGDGL
jgi:hypothetical protein